MDTQSPPILFDVKRGGKAIPAVATVNKNALMFILDRVTGKPIFGVEERPVPQSNVPGEQTSPTQPFPVLPEPLAQNTIRRDNLYKDTPEHKAWCEKLVDDNNMLLGEVPFTPIALDRYTVGFPGTQGGVNYYGGAYDPKLGLFVVNVNNLAQPMRMVKMPDGTYANSGPLAGTRRFWNPDNHLPCGPTPWGQLVAVNVNTGKIAWRSTLGISEILPAGKQNTGRPGLGGAIVTASGLTFVGAVDDFRFRAFDTRTGKELWAHKLRGSAVATPITLSRRRREAICRRRRDRWRTGGRAAHLGRAGRLHLALRAVTMRPVSLPSRSSPAWARGARRGADGPAGSAAGTRRPGFGPAGGAGA